MGGASAVAAGIVTWVARRSGAETMTVLSAVGHVGELMILVMLAWLVPKYGWSWR